MSKKSRKKNKIPDNQIAFYQAPDGLVKNYANQI